MTTVVDRDHNRFSISAVTFGLLLAALLSLQLPTIAYSNSKQVSVVRDDRQLWQSGAAVRESTLNDMQAQGVDVIQIFINWNKVAPDPDSLTKSSFNESDSSTYGSSYLSEIDALVRSATKRGFTVMINPLGPAPAWASTKKSDQKFRGQHPNLTRWSRYVRAIALRYNGNFDPGDGAGKIPRVRWWGAWNEPNFGGWLQDQWKYNSTLNKKIPYSPHLYRSLYKRAVSQVRKAKVKGAKFFIGDLGPVGVTRKDYKSNIEPKRWLYEFFCLDTKGRALKGKERSARGCPKKFKKLRANGLAHHPHIIAGETPFSASKNALGITLPKTKQLFTILKRAERKNRIRKNLPVYFTEYGVRTSSGGAAQASIASSHPPPPGGGSGEGPPPRNGDGNGGPPSNGDGNGGPPGRTDRAPERGGGRGGVSYAEQAQYINESEYVGYKYSRIRGYSQYPWVDDPPQRGFESGLYTSSWVKKPSYDAFRLPIFVSKRGCNKLMVWGKVRPKTGSDKVAIQSGDGTNFVTVKTVTVKKSRRRYFKTSVKGSGACNKKWRLQWVDQNGTTYTSRVASASKNK